VPTTEHRSTADALIPRQIALTVGGLALAGAALACASPPISPEPPTVSSPTLTQPTRLAPPVASSPSLEIQSGLPPERSRQVIALLENVSTQNLASHVEALAALQTRHVNSPTVNDAAAIIYEAFQAAGGGWQVAYDDFPLTFDGALTTQRNVVASLPGSDPSAGVVVVGAHYDSRTVDITDATSRAPGADDNASGVAALLEMARLLRDTTPRATVVFIAFSGEEVGVMGSNHYVRVANERGDDIRAMIALDIIGNAAGAAGEGAIRAFSAPPDASASRQLARFVDLQGRTYLPGFEVLVQPTVDRPGRYSDHVPFSDSGIPAMRLIEAVEDTTSQHSALDLPETVSSDYLRRATQLALAIVANLAYGPPAPDAPTRLSDDTLIWSPVDGAAGYALAFRQQDALEFDTVIRVGAVTSLTWETIAAEQYTSVSIAAVDGEGLMSTLSPELTLSQSANPFHQ
jgi:hypothetical protein